jgi:hypothetical protein
MHQSNASVLNGMNPSITIGIMQLIAHAIQIIVNVQSPYPCCRLVPQPDE